MASITPTARGFRVQVFVKGVRDSATKRTKREAAAWGSARETELRDSAAMPAADKHTLAQAMQKYSEEVSPSKDGARWEQIRIAAMLRDDTIPTRKTMSAVTTEDFGLWRNHRLTQVAPGTVLREIGLLSAILEAARREWKWITVNPLSDMRKPKAPDHREIIITRQQIKAQLRAMGYSPGLPVRTVAQACAVAFLVALRSGMREGELCALTWADVFEDYCKVRAVTKGGRKTGKRDVPLIPKASRLIESMRGFDPVLVFGISAASLDAMFRKYRKRAGLSGFTFHDSRHTAATWLAQKIHILDLCKMFGWKNTKRALTYYNPKAGDIAKRITESPRQSAQSKSVRTHSA